MNKLGEENPLLKFRQLTEEERTEWEKRQEVFSEELLKDYDKFVEKMRIARIKSAQLARTRVIG
jgi:hypothetical protein